MNKGAMPPLGADRILTRVTDQAPSGLLLHGYFRSSAAWRVRVALNLKRVDAAHAFRRLRHGGQLTSRISAGAGVYSRIYTGDRLLVAEAACSAIEAFARAVPERQGDAE